MALKTFTLHTAPQEACQKERTWEEQPPPQLLPVKQIGGYPSGVTFTEVCWEEYV